MLILQIIVDRVFLLPGVPCLFLLCLLVRGIDFWYLCFCISCHISSDAFGFGKCLEGSILEAISNERLAGAQPLFHSCSGLFSPFFQCVFIHMLVISMK